ncbi:MAG: transposase [Novipirellula sp. JB048]
MSSIAPLRNSEDLALRAECPFTCLAQPYLRKDSFREGMFRMLAYKVKESKCLSASVGGYHDHVHLLAGLSRTITIAKLVENIKRETSRWAKDAAGGSSTFAWQSGYGVFSVSHLKHDAVDKYIREQSQHHATTSFQDEFRWMCERHGIEIDERYVWD